MYIQLRKPAKFPTLVPTKKKLKNKTHNNMQIWSPYTYNCRQYDKQQHLSQISWSTQILQVCQAYQQAIQAIQAPMFCWYLTQYQQKVSKLHPQSFIPKIPLNTKRNSNHNKQVKQVKQAKHAKQSTNTSKQSQSYDWLVKPRLESGRGCLKNHTPTLKNRVWNIKHPPILQYGMLLEYFRGFVRIRKLVREIWFSLSSRTITYGCERCFTEHWKKFPC